MPTPPEAFVGGGAFREASGKLQEGSHRLREVFGSLRAVIRNFRINSETKTNSGNDRTCSRSFVPPEIPTRARDFRELSGRARRIS